MLAKAQKELKRKRSGSELDAKELNANQPEESLSDMLRQSVLEGQEFNGREASQAQELDILRESVQRHRKASQGTETLNRSFSQRATEISEKSSLEEAETGETDTATSRYTAALDRSLSQRATEISEKSSLEEAETGETDTATSRFITALDRSLSQRATEISGKNDLEETETGEKETLEPSKAQKFKEALSQLISMADMQVGLYINQIAQEEVGAVGGEVGGNLAAGNLAGANFGGNMGVYAMDMQMQARANQMDNVGGF
jgi:hypothetical protein